MNIPKKILKMWDNFLKLIEQEDIYKAGFDEGYKLAIDEGSSEAYNDGYKDGKEDYE